MPDKVEDVQADENFRETAHYFLVISISPKLHGLYLYYRVTN